MLKDDVKKAIGGQMTIRSRFIFFATILWLLIGCSGGSSASNTPAEAPQTNQNSGSGSDCDNVELPKSGTSLKYCIRDFGVSSLPKNIVYFIHGIHGSEQDMYSVFNAASPLYKYIMDLGTSRVPLVISISLGPTETLPLERPGETVHSINEILEFAFPAIESKLKYKYEKTVPPARHLVGMSLGGFNAFNLAVEKIDYFKSLTALCPALIDFNPFDPKEMEAYIKRYRAVVDRELIVKLVSMLKHKYGTYENWTVRNPIQQMKQGRFHQLPIFVSTGADDEYGFEEGASEFFKAAYVGSISRHSTTWVRSNGKHCSFDFEYLKTFLNDNLQ